MKILFVWPGVTGYMGDCWRELAAREGVELKVAVDLGEKYFGGAFKSEEVMRGLDWGDKLPEAWEPEVVFSVGWSNKMCRMAAKRWSGVKKVCCFDMPWEWKLRKVAARWVLRRYLRNFVGALVPGAQAARYARWLGFGKVWQGLFGTETGRFRASAQRNGGFLYVGREAKEKGIDVLKTAYELYRMRGGTWDLKVVSAASPDEVARYYGEAEAFVLASREEPWGVVLAEAAAAGLPIICTDKCGARHEVVKGNGIIVKAGDAEALSRAMEKVARMDESDRLAMGKKGRKLAEEFGCAAWADRVLAIAKELTGKEGS